MKKVFGNKLYDTDKSELIFETGKWCSHASGKVEIYKTFKGNYFVIESCMGCIDNIRLYPITEATVKYILKNDQELYDKYFTDKIELA